MHKPAYILYVCIISTFTLVYYYLPWKTIIFILQLYIFLKKNPQTSSVEKKSDCMSLQLGHSKN